MLDPDPFSPLAYWPHVILGISSILFAVLALSYPKGSRNHRWSGLAFFITMSVAAITAIAFSFVRLAPAALFSCAVVFYGLGTAVLSLRKREGFLRALQYALPLIAVLITFASLAAGATAVFALPEAPVPFPVRALIAFLALLVGVFFASLAIGDFRFLRDPAPEKTRRYRRHGFRMAIAATETIRAPFISFGPPLGADGLLSFPVYFFGPFLLVPLIYYLAMPAWVRSGHEQPAKSSKLRPTS